VRCSPGRDLLKLAMVSGGRRQKAWPDGGQRTSSSSRITVSLEKCFLSFLSPLLKPRAKRVHY